ncbi:MAG: hypothetical protein AAGI15_00680 [Pseudomonadota bacterium]
MCLRPDIVYVVPRGVYATYYLLEQQGFHGATNGFHTHCEEALSSARANGDAALIRLWEQVLDFGTRHSCSPLSAVEVEGVEVYESPLPVDAAQRLRLYIGNPANPPHEPGQSEITRERLALINADR